MKNIKTLVICVFILTTSACNYSQAADGLEMVVISGAVRQDLYDCSKWRYISDSEHKPSGVNHLVISTSDDLRLTLNYGVSYKAVGSLIVTPDETFTYELDLSVGASVGLSFSHIYMRDQYGKLNPSVCLNQPKGNLWVYGVMYK